jgi:hypothetical protein
MLFAHMDQLGFVVRKIEAGGFIRLERLGRVPERALAAQELLWLANGGAKGDYCHAVLSLKASGDRKFIEVPKKQSKEALSRFRFMLDTHKANQQIQSWKGK